jgi:hypothetical protein
MNRLMVIVVAMILAGNAWAIQVDDPCRVHEEQEMNDMTDQELKHEIDLMRKKVASNLKYGNEMALQSDSDADKETKKAYKNARICGEQSSRLLSVRSKRPNYSAKSERTYEDVVKEFYIQNFQDTSLYERLFKNNESDEGVKPTLLTIPKN